MDNDATKSSGLLPRLGLFITVTIVIGAIIGSGIFKKPALMAGQVGSPEILLALWVVAGIITLFGALTNAEIAGLLPRTGGQYIYFQEMYGKFFGFLYGWSIFAVIQTGSIASIAYVFGDYSTYFFSLPNFSTEIEYASRIDIPFIGSIFPLKDIGVKLVTIALITFLSTVNYIGVRLGGSLTSVFTVLKLVAIATLITIGFLFGNGSLSNYSADIPNFAPTGGMLFVGIIGALSGAFWAYDGWNNITYIAGEVRKPQKNIPLALIIGSISVMCIYILINLAYLYVLPIEVMAGSNLVATDVASKGIGSYGAAFINAAVMISTFGTASGTIMVSARVYFAMSRDNIFFPGLGKVHRVFHTPANALIVQCIWANLLVLSGTFDMLTDMLIFVSWIFYAFGAYGVFVLRKKYPDAERPYKVIGYPVVPWIFIIFAAIYVIFTMYSDIVNYYEGKEFLIKSLFGIFLVALGIPFYLYFTKRIKPKEKTI